MKIAILLLLGGVIIGLAAAFVPTCTAYTGDNLWLGGAMMLGGCR